MSDPEYNHFPHGYSCSACGHTSSFVDRLTLAVERIAAAVEAKNTSGPTAIDGVLQRIVSIGESNQRALEGYGKLLDRAFARIAALERATLTASPESLQ